MAPEPLVGQIQGIPVLVDASLPTNLGASTDEDRVIITHGPSNLFFESSVRTRVLTEVLSGTLQVRLQVYGYIAATFERYPTANTVISGTGLKPPTFT